MHRIDGPGNAAGHFTDGDPVTGVEPTQVTADFMEAVQEEIAAVIENTGAVLSKGDNTQLLQAVSAGLINPWSNRLHNTQFEFWQRHGSDPWEPSGTISVGVSAGSEYFGPDRWIVRPGDGSAAATYGRRAFTLGTVPVGLESQGQPHYYAEIVQTTGSTSTKPSIRQRIEGVRTFAGLKVTVSFLARVTSGTLSSTVLLTQGFGTTGSPSTDVELESSALTLTTTWTRFSATFTLGTLTSKTIGTDGNDHLEVGITFPTGTTFTVQLTDVRISPGSTTNNTILLPSHWDFLNCLRYYEKSYRLEDKPGSTFFNGERTGMGECVSTGSSQLAGSDWDWVMPKRITPTPTSGWQSTRPSGHTDAHYRVWRPGTPATLGNCLWGPNGAPLNLTTVHPSGTGSAKHAPILYVSNTGQTGAFMWEIQYDVDAEIVYAP